MRTSGLRFLPNPTGKAFALAGNSMVGIVTRQIRSVDHRYPARQFAMMLYVRSWLRLLKKSRDGMVGATMESTDWSSGILVAPLDVRANQCCAVRP